MATEDARGTSRMPGIVTFAVWLSFFNTWVLFEETVIDRYSWWEYLPYYRVGKLCAWDIGAMVLFGYGVWWALRGRKRRQLAPTSGQGASMGSTLQ